MLYVYKVGVWVSGVPSYSSARGTAQILRPFPTKLDNRGHEGAELPWPGSSRITEALKRQYVDFIRLENKNLLQ